MPPFFQFRQGSESHAMPNQEPTPLPGRFRALPPRPGPADRPRRASQLGLLSSGRGSVHVGYGTLVAAGIADEAGITSDDEDDDDDRGNGNGGGDDDDADDEGDEGDTAGMLGPSTRQRRGPRSAGARRRGRWRAWARRAWKRWVTNLWVEPKQSAVKWLLDGFWARYAVLVLLPAAMAVGWCALPFPQYPLDEDTASSGGSFADYPTESHKTPGHGGARVKVNFWFFLLVYYGIYNLAALVWITKLFNLYCLNWWPNSLGFPLTFFLILFASLAVPIPVYLAPPTRFLTVHNTAWISWTFVVMAVPLAIALLILTSQERHVVRRSQLSDAQGIFAPSWWAGEPGSLRRHDAPRPRRAMLAADTFDDPALADPPGLGGGGATEHAGRAWARGRGLGRSLGGDARACRPRLSASFVRFLWFCVALLVGLSAYLLGEAYAEYYLRTLPHDNLETVVYVYSWVGTVHLLDALTAWILGVREGERVGSYPLSWVFKLYFSLTYQTYIRALYARLRSPQQFVLLQVLSSVFLIVLTPLFMTRFFHRAMTVLNLTGQSYQSYKKLCVRNVFIRFLAENASMAAFLGSVLVLHLGANQDVYPYFAFDDPSEPYDFRLTFYASSVTWACELAASLCVRLVIGYFFGVDVTVEGKLDLAVWPELLPTCVAVMLHVLQNMFFSIIRLQFW